MCVEIVTIPVQLDHQEGKRHHWDHLKGTATQRRGSARITTRLIHASQTGPFDQWPNGMGFEYFYGFVGGDASQWQPNLYRNTTAVYPSRAILAGT